MNYVFNKKCKSLEEYKTNGDIIVKQSNLNILYTNIRTIRNNKIEELEHIINNTKDVDIIILSETSLKEQEEKYYQIKGCNGYFCSRDNKIGGGVAIYLSKEISGSLINKVNIEDSSIIKAKISNLEFTLTLLAYYRPSTTPLETFLETLDLQ